MATVQNIVRIASILFIVGSSALEIDIYRHRHIPYEAHNKDTNDSVVLYKYLNGEYYSLISVGSPAKQFKVTFDTAWGDTWLPSQHCGYTQISCLLHTRYDSSKSSTYREDGRKFSRSSKDFSLSGFFSVDNFHLPHMELKNQTFIEITQLSRLPFIFDKADGIIGLGFNSLATNGTTGFFYNLVKQQLIKEQVFTFYMNRDPTTEKAGKLLLGATERSYAKTNLTFFSVTEKKYWTVHMDRVVVDSNNKSYAFCATGCDAIFDTSSNQIVGPAADIQKINNFINARQITPTWPYRYMVDCREFAKLPHVRFVLGGKDFAIESKYYIQHFMVKCDDPNTNNKPILFQMTYMGFTMCLSPFSVGNDNDSWVLGGAFLMQFYTEFDVGNGIVGIAETVF